MIKKRVEMIFIYWIPVVLWASIIFTFSAKPSIPTSEVYWQDFAIKKIAHMGFYGILAALLYRALRGEGLIGKVAGTVAMVTSSLYGVTDEVHQSFTPGRDPTVRDVFFDTIGAILAILVIWKLLPKAPKKLKNLARKLHLI